MMNDELQNVSLESQLEDMYPKRRLLRELEGLVGRRREIHGQHPKRRCLHDQRGRSAGSEDVLPRHAVGLWERRSHDLVTLHQIRQGLAEHCEVEGAPNASREGDVISRARTAVPAQAPQPLLREGKWNGLRTTEWLQRHDRIA
jgi:hypothetical protein